MKETLLIYIVIGVLFIVPLLAFNVRRIFVKKAPDPLKINVVRGVVILLLAGFIAFFLVEAYGYTIHNRYEIAIERVAEKHGEYLTGRITQEDFRAFLEENGTERVLETFDQADLSVPAQADQVRFQLSSQYTPKYWQDNEAFEQTDVVDGENPVYAMYLLQVGDQKEYFVIRMRQTKERGWIYEWFGNASEEQQGAIRMPTEKNGKWYTVRK